MSDLTESAPTANPSFCNDLPHHPHANSIAGLRTEQLSRPTNINTICPLLDLPPEMRLDIYELALLDAKPALSSPSLLQTCSLINMEARPTLYKRPASFPSQAKLFDWIDDSRKQDLKRIRTLTLRLTDIDLSSLIDQSSPSTARETSLWARYQAELGRLDDALRALPNLSSLTIVPPKAGRSQLLKGLYHSFLSRIPRRCAKLKRLEVQDDEQILPSVPVLRQIREVVFAGSSVRSTDGGKGGSLVKSAKLDGDEVRNGGVKDENGASHFERGEVEEEADARETPRSRSSE